MNATTFQAFGMNTDILEVEGIDEYYHSGRETGRQKTPSEYAKDFKKFYESVEERIAPKKWKVCLLIHPQEDLQKK